MDICEADHSVRRGDGRSASDLWQSMNMHWRAIVCDPSNGVSQVRLVAVEKMSDRTDLIVRLVVPKEAPPFVDLDGRPVELEPDHDAECVKAERQGLKYAHPDED